MKNEKLENVNINGCGPSYFGPTQLKMIPFSEFFKECCDVHDYNYGNCGFKKQDADVFFLDCMLDKINKASLEDQNIWPRARRALGYSLYGLVDLFGCKAYTLSQKEVCSCN